MRSEKEHHGEQGRGQAVTGSEGGDCIGGAGVVGFLHALLSLSSSPFSSPFVTVTYSSNSLPMGRDPEGF